MRRKKINGKKTKQNEAYMSRNRGRKKKGVNNQY